MIYCGVSVKKSLFERDKHRVKNGSFNKDWVKVKKKWTDKLKHEKYERCYVISKYGME